MISTEEALKHISAYYKNFGTTNVPLLEANGRVLAENVVATRDFPPFNRVTMDGIAINSMAFNIGNRLFPIEKTQAAGQPVQRLENEKQAVEVMTGAILPQNTDVVIPYEDCILEDGTAAIHTNEIRHFQNVHRQGSDSKAGDILLKKGNLITSGMIGILASEGLTIVPVLALPKVAVCSSGDELVDLHEIPQPWQIRRSNCYVLAACLKKENISAGLHHIPDEPVEMEEQLSELIKNQDVILFSGGVSKGKFDFLPGVLQKLGMQKVFHGVAQKPGKPFLFGVFENGTIAFCFPGNPVSSFVCYQYYFKRWLYGSLGIQTPEMKVFLSKEVHFKPPLSYHLLVKLSYQDGITVATPVENSGSGDLIHLAEAEGILTLPANKELFKKNELYDLLIL